MKYCTQLLILAATLLAACGYPLADTDAADAFVHETYRWSQELTHLGEEYGLAFNDLYDGKTKDSDLVHSILETTTKLVTAGIEEFSNRPLPPIPELAAYREEFLAYLQWQADVAIPTMGKVIAALEEKNLTAEQRDIAVRNLFMEGNAQEMKWKARVEYAMNTLYKRIN